MERCYKNSKGGLVSSLAICVLVGGNFRHTEDLLTVKATSITAREEVPFRRRFEETEMAKLTRLKDNIQEISIKEGKNFLFGRRVRDAEVAKPTEFILKQRNLNYFKMA